MGLVSSVTPLPAQPASHPATSTRGHLVAAITGAVSACRSVTSPQPPGLLPPVRQNNNTKRQQYESNKQGRHLDPRNSRQPAVPFNLHTSNQSVDSSQQGVPVSFWSLGFFSTPFSDKGQGIRVQVKRTEFGFGWLLWALIRFVVILVFFCRFTRIMEGKWSRVRARAGLRAAGWLAGLGLARCGDAWGG
jgi:hypothetical protein